MRRALDVLLAAILLIVLAPALMVVWLLVRWRMGSPAFFVQRRVGRRGQEFSIVKFRSMRLAEWAGQPDAERETRLGRALRTTSVDELPQLWNVLRGDMSLIGPRPTLPEQVAHYSPRQHGRHAVRPGLTGWAQVNGRNRLSWPERIELDLWYIEHRSVALDARILLRTLLRLLLPSGVYAESGVNPGFPASTNTEAAPSTRLVARTTQPNSQT